MASHSGSIGCFIPGKVTYKQTRLNSNYSELASYGVARLYPNQNIESFFDQGFYNFHENSGLYPFAVYSQDRARSGVLLENSVYSSGLRMYNYYRRPWRTTRTYASTEDPQLNYYNGYAFGDINSTGKIQFSSTQIDLPSEFTLLIGADYFFNNPTGAEAADYLIRRTNGVLNEFEFGTVGSYEATEPDSSKTYYYFSHLNNSLTYEKIYFEKEVSNNFPVILSLVNEAGNYRLYAFRLNINNHNIELLTYSNLFTPYKLSSPEVIIQPKLTYPGSGIVSLFGASKSGAQPYGTNYGYTSLIDYFFKPTEYVKASGNSSDDTKYVQWKIPYGSGGIVDATILYNYHEHPYYDKDPKIYDISSPMKIGTTYVAPSAIRIEVVAECDTNLSSGVRLEFDTYMYNGLSTYTYNKTYALIPSGTKQTYTTFVDYSGTFGHWLSPTTSTVTPIITTNINNTAGGIQTLIKPIVHRDNLGYANLKIYSAQVLLDAWAIASTGNSSVTLFTSGTYATKTGGIDLFLDNHYGVSQHDLYIRGFMATSGTIPLYINAGTKSETTTLITTGYIPHSSGITLYTENAVVNTSGTTLFIEGIFRETTSMPLYTVGPTLYSQSGNTPMFVWGTAGATGYRAGHSLYTKSEKDPNFSMNLFTTGPSHADYASNMPLFIKNDNSFNSSTSLYLKNEYVAQGSGISLYASGIGQTENAIPVNASMQLFISRSSESYAKTTPLYVKANEQNSSSTTLFIDGVYKDNSGIPLYSKGIGDISDSVKLYSHGH